ncbi:unnamed protein product, partial [Bubo scandiacus]
MGWWEEKGKVTVEGLVGELLLLGGAVGLPETILVVAITITIAITIAMAIVIIVTMTIGVPGELGLLGGHVASVLGDKCCAGKLGSPSLPRQWGLQAVLQEHLSSFRTQK